MEHTLTTIVIGADHRGFRMKEEISRSLSEWGYLVKDVGARAYNPDDDFPDIAIAAGEEVRRNPHTYGIIMCGSGVGMAVAANKIRGVRAALCASPAQAIASRHDDDANVLVLAADFTTTPLARRIVKSWLATAFGRKERYMRRLRKIEKIEASLGRQSTTRLKVK